MSEMERNKGKLYPINVDTENFTEEDFDSYREKGFMVLNGEIFKVGYEVKSEKGMMCFSEVVDDGINITFHTIHYNGGGSLEEVLQQELKRQFKEIYIGK